MSKVLTPLELVIPNRFLMWPCAYNNPLNKYLLESIFNCFSNKFATNCPQNIRINQNSLYLWCKIDKNFFPWSNMYLQEYSNHRCPNLALPRLCFFSVFVLHIPVACVIYLLVLWFKCIPGPESLALRQSASPTDSLVYM